MAFSFKSAAQRMRSWLKPRKPLTLRRGSRLLFEMLEDRLTPAAPTLTATPYPTTVTLGGPATTLTDTAVLANGVDPTGTIIFDLLGPSGNFVDSESVTVDGNGTYTTPTGYALPITGSVAGSYTWEVDYSGDSNNMAAIGNMVTLGSFDSTTGALPQAGLVEDSSGNFFGTTQFGLGNGQGSPLVGDGTVFEMAAGTGAITTLAVFNGSNGANPQASLIEDANGNLFGTTLNGGDNGDGTVFEVAAGSNTITTLASFNGSNGANPSGGLIEDSNGNLFGTTLNGGDNGDGVVFEVAAGSNTITTIASFNGSNGANPAASLIEDSSGDFFSTTVNGGDNGDGVVFEVAAGSNTITTLASFNGSNGANPYASLIEDGNGDLLGTAYSGGDNGAGTVFEVAAGSNIITTIASFNGNDGASPNAGLVEDSSGDLFGTTLGGGPPGFSFGANYPCGTVFEIQAGSDTITTLDSFNVYNGENIYGGLIEDSNGNLFGTAAGGGATGEGALFELSSTPLDQVSVIAANDLVISPPTESITYGSDGTVTVYVNSAYGTPTGDVNLSVDNGTPLTESLVEGSATFTLTGLTAGAHTLSAEYAAQDGFLASSGSENIEVAQAATTTTISAPSVPYDTNAQVTVAVGTTEGVPSPTGSVALTVNGVAFETEALGADGTAVFTITNAADCQLGASFSGNSNYIYSDSTSSLTVTPAATQTGISQSTITYGNSASVTVSVASGAGVVPGNVMLSIDGNTAVSQTLSGGSSTFTISGLSAGNHTLTATYSAQGYFATSTTSSSIIVNQAATTTSLSAPSIIAGNNAIVKAAVQAPPGLPTPSGSVTLTVNGVAQPPVNLLQGVATFTVAGLAAGSYTLSVTFSAQGNYAASSNTATLVVSSPTSASFVTSNGLEFRPITGNFTESGNVFTSTQTVQVGFTPATGQPFVPLLQLQSPSGGTVTINLGNQTISSGQVNSTAGLELLGSLSNAGIPALVSGSGITGLKGTSFNVAGVGFVLGSLGLTDTGGTPQVQMQGSLTLPDGLGVALGGSTYVTIAPNSNPSLSSFNATASGTLSVAGVTLASSNFAVAYTSSNLTFTVTGSASATIGDISNLRVQLGGTSLGEVTQGLVIVNGSVNTFNMVVMSKFEVGSEANFSTNGLMLSWAGGQFTMTGSASLSVGSYAAVTVTFGQGSTPGLELSSQGALEALNLTVTGSLNLSGVTLSLTGVNFTYTASSDQFTIGSGSAGLAIAGTSPGSQGRLDINFGSTDQAIAQGLVITDGQLTSLNVTVNGYFSVNLVQFGVSNLLLTYDAGTFAMSGSAGVTLAGTSVSPFSITFGTDNSSGTLQNNGLVITKGSLSQLNMTVNTDLVVGGVFIYADNLQFDYTTVGGDVFSMSGSAGVSLKGISDRIEVSFAQNGGLVIKNGSLTSLNMTVTSSFSIGAVTISTDSLNFIYSAPGTFSLSGQAQISTKHVLAFTVSFGTSSAPGLVLSGDTLESLNMEVTAGIKLPAIPDVTPEVDLANIGELDFTYLNSTSTFTMTGVVGTTIDGFGLELEFNNPGLVIDNNGLESLNMTLVGDLTVGAVSFVSHGLNFQYSLTQISFFGATLSYEEFTVTGDATLSTPAGSLSVDFGGNGTQGLEILNTTLISMDMAVVGNINLEGLSFINADLIVTYSDNTLTMTGGGSATIPTLGSVGVNFGGGGTQGLVIDTATDQLESLNMEVTANFGLGGITFVNANMEISYSSSIFDITGGASFSIPMLGSVSLDLGGNGTNGLEFGAGAFYGGNLEASLNFSPGLDLGIYGTMDMSYTGNNTFQITGDGTIYISGFLSLNAVLGGGGTSGIVISNGSVTAINMDVNGGISVLGVSASVNLDASYNSGNNTFQFDGTASASLASPVPSWARSFLGTASVNFEILDAGYTNTSFFDLSTSIAGETVGIQVYFNGSVYITMGDPLTAAWQQISDVASDTYMATANAMAGAYKTASNGVVGAYNETASALESAVTSAGSLISTAKSAVETGWNDFCSIFGPLSGATVYYDPNDDYDFSNDISSVTASDGTFELAIPAGSTAGQIVIVGGTDQSTGLANTTTITAPLDATVVGPFSTLVNDIVQQTGTTEGLAVLAVQQAFGIPSTINPLVDNYINQALGGDPQAANVFATEVQLTALADQVDSLLSAAGGGNPSSVSIAFFNNLASTIVQTGASPLDLTNPTIVQSLIQATATSVGVSLDPTIASGAATISAGVDQFITALPVAGSASYLNQVVQAQTVAENTIAPLLEQVATGTTDIATVVAAETGPALAAQIAAASVGSIDLDGPLIEIGNLVEQPVGNGDPSTFQFTVYLASTDTLTQPVSVEYTTEDGTATSANGDYTPVSGTLTWEPGDTAPQTITVPVSATGSFAANKTFDVVLSNPVNASIQSGVGVGDISFTDIATTTALSTSDSEINYGDPVTLTATVTNQDPNNDPGTGTVAFFNGSMVLGSATLSNGSASLTVSDLLAGNYSITAVYQGNQTLGASSDPSVSSPAPLTVNAAPQTISFLPLSDQSYGNADFNLFATASSGLPVTYSIVSGPATVADDVVTITGAGEITVEADQAGDANNQAAPSVDESFNVAPAALVVTVDNQSMVYGDTLPNLTYSISGYVNGDDASALDQPVEVSTVPATSNVGSYDITASGADSPNYTFVYVNGTLSITPAPLLISADSPSAVYGSTPNLTATYIGLVNGDTPASLTTLPTLSSIGEAGSPVGNYDISASSADDPNYDITYSDGILTVTPAPLVFTADNQTAVYAAAIPTLTGAYSGFVNGDTVNSLTAPATIGTSAAQGSNAGSYDIAASGAVDPNYNISYVDGTLTISPYAFTYQIGNDSQSYGDPANLTADLPAFIPTGINGETLEIAYSSTGDSPTANVGSYPITASLGNGTDNASNYNVTLEPGTLTVTIASPTLSAAASTTNPTLGTTTVVLGTGSGFTASATISNGDEETGTITFTLYGPNNTVATTETTMVNGNGPYTTPTAYTPSVTGVYQWTASYGGDSNNNVASTTMGGAPENAIGAGSTVLGNSLYLVGGGTNDTVNITAMGSSQTGSTGITFNGKLNNVTFKNQNDTGITTIYVFGFGGSESVQLASSLTVAAVVSAGNGNDNILLGNGSNIVTLGNGNDTVQAGSGVNGVNLGSGNDKVHFTSGGGGTVTVGNGNDIIQAGAGTGAYVIDLGNGNDTVQLGNGNGTLMLGSAAGTGNDTVVLGSGNNTITGGNGSDSVQLGNGINSVTLGNGNDTIQAGTGVNSVNLGSGNDKVHFTSGGGGTVVVGDGNDIIQAGAGTGAYVIDLGNGNDTIQLGNGNNTLMLGTVSSAGNDTVVLGNGNNTITGGNGFDKIQMGNGKNSVTLGNGNDTIQAGTGVNSVALGSGNDIVNFSSSGGGTVALGNGNDNVIAGAGGGTYAIDLGNGNDNVQLGSGNNTVVAGNGTDKVRLGFGANALKLGNVSNTVTLGDGNDDSVTIADTRDSTDIVKVGNGDKDSVSISGSSTGNDNIAVGNGTSDSVLILNTGNDTVQTGTGSGTVMVTSGKKNVQLGSSGWTQI